MTEYEINGQEYTVEYDLDNCIVKVELYHKNYLDHVYAVSDDSSDILEHYRYTAFGEVTIYDENEAQVT